MERVDIPRNQQSKCLIFLKKIKFLNEIVPVLFNKTNEILHIFLLYIYLLSKIFYFLYF
jgi:hypothetical protein